MIELVVDKTWVERATRWACRRVQHTIDRSNMNLRGLTERLDDIVMGEIGSAAVAQFLVNRGNCVIAYDEVRRDGNLEPDPGWDLVVGPALDQWPEEDSDVRTPPVSAHTISVKTSRIPKADNDSVELAIERRDFKVFKRSEAIEDDLSSDYESQIYYPLYESKMRDTQNITQTLVATEAVEEINSLLRLGERYGRCFLTGFVSKETLVDHSQSLIEAQKSPYWTSWHGGEAKEMWSAPLHIGRLP